MKSLIFFFLFLLFVHSLQRTQTSIASKLNTATETDVSKRGQTPVYLKLIYPNYSQYTLPSRKPWGRSDKTLKTYYEAIRFDPKTLLVDTSDRTFSKSTGKVSHFKDQKSALAYGTAFGCQKQYYKDGHGKIDLRGTDYAIDDEWKHRGEGASGSAKFSYNNQVVTLKGGGYCGWIAPIKADSVKKAYRGGRYLKLKKIYPLENIKGKYYLSLPKKNYSGYTLPSRKPWGKRDKTLYTTYNKIRVNPKTLIVDTSDIRFTKSTGIVSHHKSQKKYVPYGTAQGCQGKKVKDGKALIDLRGTQFAINDNFKVGGYHAAGYAKKSQNNQYVSIRGGGYCGWIAPVNAKGKYYVGGNHLKLKELEFYKHEKYYYLNLVYPNYSGYTLPKNMPWGRKDSTLTTNFFKLRIDSKKLLIKTNDYTFAASNGKVSHHKKSSTRVPFGTAFGCTNKKSDGIARIDLRGTGFKIKDMWTHRGSGKTMGTATATYGRQVVDIRGGGHCGWNAPKKAKNEKAAYMGGWYIQLERI
jgi:hypothetical protein